MAKHCEDAAEGLENCAASHPPEHGGERGDIMGCEEVGQGCGKVGGEVAVTGDEEE